MAAEYCALAAGVLLPFADAAPVEAPSRGRTSTPTTSWAFQHILFGASSRIAFDSRHLRARVDGRAVVPGVREEAFPGLWDSEPDSLALLLDGSRHADVHRFAARALRGNRTAWYRIPMYRLIRWFDAPYPETGELAAEVAVTRYDPKDPYFQLVLALLAARTRTPRRTAEPGSRRTPRCSSAIFRSSSGWCSTPAPRPAGSRSSCWARARSSRTTPAQVIEAVLRRRPRRADVDREATVRLRDAAAVLLAAFARELSDWPMSGSRS